MQNLATLSMSPKSETPAKYIFRRLSKHSSDNYMFDETKGSYKEVYLTSKKNKNTNFLFLNPALKPITKNRFKLIYKHFSKITPYTK